MRSPFLTNRRGAEDTEEEERDKRMNNNQPISASVEKSSNASAKSSS
jgi:hypothetical protein